LEAADLTTDEPAATRRKLAQRVADLEDELAHEPCPVIAPKEEAPLQEPGCPLDNQPNPLVDGIRGFAAVGRQFHDVGSKLPELPAKFGRLSGWDTPYLTTHKLDKKVRRHELGRGRRGR